MVTKTRLALVSILALGAFLRFHHLNGYGLWSDEFVTLMIVGKASYGELIKTCFDVPQPLPPLYFLLNKLVFGFFTPSEAALRLFSAISGFATGYVLFALGKALSKTEIGLWSSLFFAVNSTQIVYAQNARPYSFCLLLGSLSMLYFLRWLQKPSSRGWQAGYLLSTTLLFYTHYIFFPLLFVQNLYFLWTQRTRRAELASKAAEQRSALQQGQKGREFEKNPWMENASGSKGSVTYLAPPSKNCAARERESLLKTWLCLQILIGSFLVPLYPQLWQLVQARHGLNWERRYPGVGDFLMFVSLTPLLYSVGISLLAGAARLFFRKFSGRAESRRPGELNLELFDSIVLASLWCGIPLTLFFLLAHSTGINLFVERYLICASLPIFFLLPLLAFAFQSNLIARTFLLSYLCLYVYWVPATYFIQKGEFSQGVPGGNEWRETLSELNRRDFEAPILLFQSPFIESNQLGYASNPQLLDYLSAPLKSFYVKDSHRPVFLLPVHWWIDSPAHRAFKIEIMQLLETRTEFTLLSTQEFWDSFEPWLRRESSGRIDWQTVRSFRSSGALQLSKLQQK